MTWRWPCGDRRFSEECLNTSWFLSLDDARDKVEACRRHDNESRPHTALGYVPPSEFAVLLGPPVGH
jgi:putative transposase